jgi:hypothetical protein
MCAKSAHNSRSLKRLYAKDYIFVGRIKRAANVEGKNK